MPTGSVSARPTVFPNSLRQIGQLARDRPDPVADTLGERPIGLGRLRRTARRRGQDRPTLRGRVEEAHCQLDHPDAVGDRVVGAREDGAAALEAVDQEHRPQRTIPIERFGPLRGDERLEFGITTRRRQVDVLEVRVE